MLVMELCMKGSLKEFLKVCNEQRKASRKGKPILKPKQLQHFCFQVARVSL